MARKNNSYTEEEARRQLAEAMSLYNRYRHTMFVLGIVCVGILASSMALYKGGVIDGDVQTVLISSSFIFIAIMLILSFTKIRPLKADIGDWDAELVKAEVDPSHKISEPTTNAQEDLLSVKHPPTAQYKKLRRVWYANVLAATAIMLISMLMIRMNPDDLGTALFVLCGSYVFIFIAVYYDRKKLKPLREQYKRQLEKEHRKETRKQSKKGH